MIWNHKEITDTFMDIVPNEKERDYTLINPASFDVRIGHGFKTEQHREGKFTPAETIQPSVFGETRTLQDGEIYWLKPAELILVSMYEKITVPLDLAMQFFLKSSRAREGYDHVYAGWVDPGWSGYLTLEIKNNLAFTSLPITPGLRIGQVVVHDMSSESVPYSGRYQGATSIEASKPKAYDIIL